jgi:hypothetical protein
MIEALSSASPGDVFDLDGIEQLQLPELERLAENTSELEVRAWILVKLCEAGVGFAALNFIRFYCIFVFKAVDRALVLEKELAEQNYSLPTFAAMALGHLYAEQLHDVDKSLSLLRKMYVAKFARAPCNVSLVVRKRILTSVFMLL